MSPAQTFTARIPANRSVRALVLEQHAASRIGFGMLLRKQPWIGRCYLTANREEAVTLAQRARLDLAIVDITAATHFIDAYIAPLRMARPTMSILLSTHESVLTAPPARSSGVAGLLTPEYSTEQIISAVRMALAGQTPPEPRGTSALKALSSREREVLMLLSTGATNREIASAMHVSVDTVKKHAAALYRKLGVRNRTEAAQRAPGRARV